MILFRVRRQLVLFIRALTALNFVAPDSIFHQFILISTIPGRMPTFSSSNSAYPLTLKAPRLEKLTGVSLMLEMILYAKRAQVTLNSYFLQPMLLLEVNLRKSCCKCSKGKELRIGYVLRESRETSGCKLIRKGSLLF